MLNNPNDRTVGANNWNDRFTEDAPVYDVGGNQVGTVSEHGVQAGCLVVHHGIMKTDVYVPLSDISGASAQAVHLSVDSDQFENFSKNEPPANTGAGLGRDTAGYAQANRSGVDADRARQLGNLPGNVDQRLNQAGNSPLGAGEVGIPVVEERLRAEKERGEAGRVRVHKDVVEQPEVVSAPVTHEELRVEHNPVRDNIPAGEGAFQNQDVEIPLMGEQLNVQKQAGVVDELHLHKREVTENQQVQGTVRRERVNIEGVDQPLNAQPLNDDQNLNAPQQ